MLKPIRTVTLTSFAFALSSILIMGCSVSRITSVVNPSQTGGLTTLATWKASAESKAAALPANDEASKSKYDTAAAAVSGVIATFKSQVSVEATQSIGAVNLSDDQIPVIAKQQVDDFLKGARSTAGDIGKIIEDEAKAERQASAKAISDELDSLNWKSWADLHH